MKRPRFSISVLRGLMRMADLAHAELMIYSQAERLEMLDGSKGSREWDRAAAWINDMRHWYMSKEVKS